LNGEHTKPVESRTEDPSVEAIAESEAELAAFPVVIPFEGAVQYFGITKRELFAAMAMQGNLSCPLSKSAAKTLRETGMDSHEEFAKLIAKSSVEYADALLAELEKKK